MVIRFATGYTVEGFFTKSLAKDLSNRDTFFGILRSEIGNSDEGGRSVFCPRLGKRAATRTAEDMKGLRRDYYNLFSRVYDGFIRLHSGDNEGLLRRFIVERAKLAPGDRILDLCTGTGSVALEFAGALGERGMVVGLDFSRGMLKKAREKSSRSNLPNLHLVEADASMLPFKDSCFNAVTCSHAFYELKGSDRKRAIDEVARVIRERGKFCLMEHAEPEGRVAKLFFYLRIRLLGSRDARGFFENESDTLGDRFGRITTEIAPTEKSKLICGERRGAL